ncbi:MAG: amylo-alpha-1,6-glucosidase [Synergistes sp.]|nr:amylo-alpha-1,6-glucosidase [Synergistes sp.]
MYLGKADVNTYDKGAGREFLVSNGRGSYGFSTVIGANSRREHGLLVVRHENELEHSVLVSKIEEVIYHSSKKYQLSTNRYKDIVYPDGYRYLQEYQGNPFPSMLFVIHSILLKKSIFMPQGAGCTIVKYELLAAPEKIRLDIRPLFAHRHVSVVCAETGKDNFSVSSASERTIGITGRGMSSACEATAGNWSLKPLWFENIVYEQDDCAETPESDSLWSPGILSVDMSEGESVYVILSEKPSSFTTGQLAEMEAEAAKRFEDILEKANISALNSAEQDMIASSYHLVDTGTEDKSPIYTGYPSVSAKARETFISLPGLLLATGREETAEKTLLYWCNVAEHNDWVVPGALFPDGKSQFGYADDGLWLVYAIDKYLTHCNDTKNKEKFADCALHIVNKYLSGIEQLDLVCDANMLLRVTGDNSCRYWMGESVDGEVVVKRKGYLVDVNSLWYNALKVAAKYVLECGKSEDADKLEAAAAKCSKSFGEVFRSFDMRGLYDFVDPNTFKGEYAIRPNQILAAALPFSPLSDEDAQSVVRLCWNELYTTYGLRTLDPHHEKFKGRSEGRPDQRIKARYRGMAWTWLLGQFITAYIKYNPTRKDIGWTFIRPFNSHLRHGCLGGIAELFDGIMPYRPNGDVLSAISLGEMLRVLYEDLEEEC